MPIYKLEFTKQISAAPETIYQHLSEPGNLIGLQPLLTRVDRIHPFEQNGRRAVSYETVEAFRWKGITLYENRIRVQTVFTDPPKQFETTVKSFPNITLLVTYTLRPLENGTLVTEEMQIECHSWLAEFVTGEARKAQTALLENLKSRFEQIIS